jgi:putative acetyltransferase
VSLDPTDDASCRRADGFSIRPADNRDTVDVRTVLLSVRREYGVLGEMQANDPDLDDIERTYLERGGCFEVVEDALGRIVGCAGLLPLDSRRAELCKMYIEAPARGRGLGKRLLENMLAGARRGGFAEVWLETNSVLTEATRLYTSHGFEPVEADGLLPKCDRAYLLRLP